MNRALRTSLAAVLVFGVARPAQAAPRPLPVAAVAAAAEPRLLVMVAPLDGPARSQAGLMEHAAEVAVSAAGRFQLVRAVDALDARGARARQDNADKAARLSKEGRARVDDLDTTGGTQMLTDAVAAWRAADLTTHFKAFIETWVLRGAGYATGDEPARARPDIERVLAMAPDTEFPNAYYSPDLLKYAETLRKQVKDGQGELVVRTEPAGARVWVDGTYRGVAPVTVKGLAGGKHLVTAVLAGFQYWQSEVGLGEELARLDPAEGAPHWKRTLEKVSKDPGGPGRDVAAREIAAAVGAEQVLLLVARKGVTGEQLDVTAVRIEAKDGHHAAFRKATVAMDSPEAVDGLVAALLERDAPRDGNKPVTHYDGAGGSRTRKVAGYSLLGAGALLIGTGIFFGAMASTRAAEFRATPQVETLKSESLASSGRAFAVVADVSYVVGGLSAATGGVLAFTNLFAGRGAPEPEPARTRDTAADDARAAQAQEEARQQEEARRQDEQRRADEARQAEEARKVREEEEARKAREEEEARGKKGKRDRKKEEEEKKKRAEEEKKAREEEERRAKEEEAARKKEEEARKKQLAQDDAKRKADEARAAEDARRAEEQRKKEEAERKAKEEERRKREEAERKKKEDEAKKKKEEDHDDLRNY